METSAYVLIALTGAFCVALAPLWRFFHKAEERELRQLHGPGAEREQEPPVPPE
jgi:hypothetical protein